MNFVKLPVSISLNMTDPEELVNLGLVESIRPHPELSHECILRFISGRQISLDRTVEQIEDIIYRARVHKTIV